MDMFTHVNNEKKQLQRNVNNDWTKTRTRKEQHTRIDVGVPNTTAIDEIHDRVTNDDQALWSLKEKTKLDVAG